MKHSFAAVDVAAVLESAQIVLFQKMDRASILRSAGATTEADRVTERVVRDLTRLAADLRDRHQHRVEAQAEIKDRAEIAARNRPTLHRLLVSRDARPTTPGAATAPISLASPKQNGASS